MTQQEAELKVVELKRAYNETRKKIEEEFISKAQELKQTHYEDMMFLNANISNCIRELGMTDDEERKRDLRDALRNAKSERERKKGLYKSTYSLMRIEHQSTITYESHKVKNDIAEVMASVDERGDRYWKQKYEQLANQPVATI